MNFPPRLHPLLPFSFAVALLALALGAPRLAIGQDAMREGQTYLGLMATRLNHRSVDPVLAGQGWSSMGSLILGTHVAQYFHAELRAGSGLASGQVDDELELDIDYYVSWYFGGHYPITGYANIYAQFGFTHLRGDASLTPLGRYRAETPQRELPAELRGPTYEDLANMEYPDSSFSTSWLLGLDLEPVDNGFLFLEAGKFFEDTGTGANVFQYNLGVRYEF